MRLAEIVSAPLGIDPEMGLSLPSNFTEKPYAVGFPSAPTPSNVYFTPSPCASTVRVRLLYPGPGSNFDFATLSFQVPTSGLLCARSVAEPAKASRAIATNLKRRFMSDPPWVRTFLVELVDVVSCGKFLTLYGPRQTTGATICPIPPQVNRLPSANGAPHRRSWM